MTLEVLEVAQGLLLTGLKEEGNSKGFHEENLESQDLPHLNGENRTGQEAEAWLLGMNKYFRIHDFSGNEKARIFIYNLNGRASIWWERLMKVK